MSQLDELDPKVAFLGGLLLAALYYFLVFDDGSALKRRTSSLQNEIDVQKKTLAGIEEALLNKKKFQDEAAEINASIESFLAYFPEEIGSAQTNEFIKEISKAAEKNSATVVSLKPAPGGNEFPDYPELGFEFTVEATYVNIMRFISDLTKLKRVIDFTETTLKVVGSEKIPRISFETTLIVYGRVKETAPNAPGAGG